MPRTPESSRQQLLQETVRSFWILGLKKSWGVSQKQLRSGMETSSCQPAQIPCFHRPLSGTQKTNTSLRFSLRVAPAHHPQAPPLRPPHTCLPSAAVTSCPGAPPTRGQGGPQWIEPQLLSKLSSAWEDLKRHPRMLGCYKPQPPHALV